MYVCVSVYVGPFITRVNVEDYDAYFSLDCKFKKECDMGEKKIEKERKEGAFFAKKSTFCNTDVTEIIKNIFLRCKPCVVLRRKNKVKLIFIN